MNPGTASASGVAEVGPKVENRTLVIDRFIALHMICVRMIPEAPTSEPATISTELLITNPVAAPASPE